MDRKCKTNPVFKAPSHAWMYYFLSFTWGLPMNFVGTIVVLVLMMRGHKPRKYGWNFAFEFDSIDWGLELGIFFIVPKDYYDLYMHEHGHGIQNVYLGLFMPFVVSLPSAIRYWYREIRYKIGNPPESSYDDIWFEGSATESGKAFLKELEKKQ